MPKKPGDGKLKLTPEDCEKIKTLASYGMKQDDIAAIFGRTGRTLRTYLAENPELKSAMQAGKASADANVIQALYKNAKDGDNKAIEFWLRNRRPDEWCADRKIDVNHKGEIDVTHSLVEKRVDKLSNILDRTRNVVEVEAGKLTEPENNESSDNGDVCNE